MERVTIPLSSRTPDWALASYSSPKEGVRLFLEALCRISGASYAHIRVLSRSGKFYTMADSIGPYKEIAWRRRFRLLDERNEQSLAFAFIDYRDTHDCRMLENKYANNPVARNYLDSIKKGLWVPLSVGEIRLGYAILSWIDDEPDVGASDRIRHYLDTCSPYLSLVFAACRSVITDRYFSDLCTASSVILSSPSEALCYDRIALACVKLWGPDSTAYVGKIDQVQQAIEVVAVEGHSSREAKRNQHKHLIPFGTGLFGFALTQAQPVISFSLSSEDRFRYHSMKTNGECQGSAIAASIRDESTQVPSIVYSVEHERDSYFDVDDLRYATGIARVSHEALSAHRAASDRIAREIDTLFTQMFHDVAEPLQALVADADVLKYQATIVAQSSGHVDQVERMEDVSNRAANIVETGLDINRQVGKYLEMGIDGAATRMTEGRVNLFRLLNSLVDTFEERAAAQGVEIHPLFDSLRGVHVQCDETELKSSLGHLLGNAIKYSFWGRRSATQGQQKYKRYVNIIGRIRLGIAIIEFQNYGVGILQGELRAVKDKFYRGELAKKEGRAGTGRGLWSASQFFESSGGGIEVSSEYKGSEPQTDEGPYFTVVRASMPYLITEES